jgi:hypothetical protein
MARTPPVIRVDASSAECLVLTEKEGLLSAVAHDLKMRVTQFELAWDGATLTARFEPSSLRVVDALKRGRENAQALGDDGKVKIEQSIVSDVLHAQRYPTIEFRSTEVVAEDKGFRIKGDLTLHGVTRRISPKVSLRGDRRGSGRSVRGVSAPRRPGPIRAGHLIPRAGWLRVACDAGFSGSAQDEALRTLPRRRRDTMPAMDPSWAFQGAPLWYT